MEKVPKSITFAVKVLFPCAIIVMSQLLLIVITDVGSLVQDFASIIGARLKMYVSKPS